MSFLIHEKDSGCRRLQFNCIGLCMNVTGFYRNHNDKARLIYLLKECILLIGTFQSIYLLDLFSYEKQRKFKMEVISYYYKRI